MKTRTRNRVACLGGWLVAFALLQWFLSWVFEAFDLSLTALGLLSFLSGVMLGAIFGYVYIALEEHRERLERLAEISRVHPDDPFLNGKWDR